MAWRRVSAAVAGEAGPAVAEMLGYAAEYERAGDTVRLRAVRSYLEMLAPEFDPAVAHLFLEFAREHHRGVA